jgi:IS30 family transposase
MARLAGKTAAETVAAMTATFRRLDPRMRGSVTFDNDTCFARHDSVPRRGVGSPTLGEVRS